MGSSVKDKTNITSYNVWSGGDQFKNTIGLSGNPTTDISTTTDYSENRDYSFKLHSPSDSSYHYSVKYVITEESLNGKTITITSDCLNLATASVSMQLVIDGTSQNVTVPSSTDFTQYTLSHTFTSEPTTVEVRWVINNSTNDDKLYFDNVSITIQ